MSLMEIKARRSSSKQALGSYLDEWVSSRAWLRPSTRACYRLHVDKHLKPALGDIRLQDLSPVQVECFALDLLASGLSAGTVERIIATLSSACATAVSTGLLDRNPVSRVRIPHRQVKVLPKWNTGHARTFLDCLGVDSLDLLFRVALMTGTRRGELLGLRWSDLDLEEGLVRIQRSRLQVGSQIIEDLTKTVSSARTVYLDPVTQRRLIRLQQRLHAGPDAHVFVDAMGNPLTPGWVSARFAKRIELMGLPSIRFHDLRHASATFGLASGESLLEVSRRLGHADVGVTARVYSEIVPATARASANRLANTLAAPEVLLVRSA